MRETFDRMTSSEIRAGALKEVCPHLYALSHTVENCPAHRNQDVLNHTLGVLAALELILKPTILPRSLHDFVTNHLSVPLPNSIGYTRHGLLKLAILFHDMGKPDTLIIDAQGDTTCPLHEDFGLRYVAQYEAAFGLKTLEADMIQHMVRDHGKAYDCLRLIEAHGQPDRYLTVLEPALQVELLLLTYADMLGNTLPLQQKRPRLNLIVETLEWLSQQPRYLLDGQS